MDFIIRNIKETENHLLQEFLYEAIYVPEGAEAPPRSILQNPELQIYVERFGQKKDDHAFVAESDGNVVGAVWVRIMNDYGHIDDETPSFAMSLYQQYRGHGIGTALMKAMLSFLREKGYQRASLAVWKENYALNMYRSAGFQIVSENSEEYIMVIELN